jgi:hypothetical protein
MQIAPIPTLDWQLRWTKKEAVNAALEEYVRTRRLKAFLDLEGAVDFDEDWDPIAHRREERRRAAELAERLWPE